jgi:hypothetical protein
MTDCVRCGTHLHLRRRHGLERLLYSDVYHCRRCGVSIVRRHRFVEWLLELGGWRATLRWRDTPETATPAVRRISSGNGGAQTDAPDCLTCGFQLHRRHRSLLERLLFSDAYYCSTCHRTTRQLHARLDVLERFVFSTRTHCVRCGTSRVHRLERRDYIDSVSHHPLVLLLRLTGAPRYKCPRCRLQYHDWRPIENAAVPAPGTIPPEYDMPVQTDLVAQDKDLIAVHTAAGAPQD